MKVMKIRTTFALCSFAITCAICWLWWSHTFKHYYFSPARISQVDRSQHSVESVYLNSKLGEKTNTNLRFESERKIKRPIPLVFNESSIRDIDIASINDIPLLASRRIPKTLIETKSKENLEDLDQTQGLMFRERHFFLNGKPFWIFSGAIHYFRTLPEYWEDRLKKLKACGLNTVETYVAWNLHEPSPGKFFFDGMLDIRNFIQLAGRLGLYVILRPGPYICSEFDFGGLPGWLLEDPNMKVRTNYPGYVAAVNRFFGVLLPMIVDLQFTEGGPIIMVQVENEYGVYGTDAEHLKLLAYIMKREGINEMFVTSDNRDNSVDFHSYALPTANFHRPKDSFQPIQALDRDFPLMVMEFWTGWFDAWGQEYHSARSDEDLDDSLTSLLNMGASINFYMFHGGTNFGFTAGGINLTSYMPFVTSYDYDALLTEAGDVTLKYWEVRKRFLQVYKQLGIKDLPKVPPNLPKASYGSIVLQEVMLWESFISVLPLIKTDKKLRPMEEYMDRDGERSTFGYIVYSRQVKLKAVSLMIALLKSSLIVHDRLMIILDGQVVDVVYGPNSPYLKGRYSSSSWQSAVELAKSKNPHGPVKLDLVVENQGRVSYSPRRLDLLNTQRKGLSGSVHEDAFADKEGWQVRFINFTPQQYDLITNSAVWKKEDTRKRESPALYRGYLQLSHTPRDTFISLKGWSKGVVLVNGFNLGRYWSLGPQQTLYLPAPLLNFGLNEIVVFEEQSSGEQVTFSDKPNLGSRSGFV